MNTTWGPVLDFFNYYFTVHAFNVQFSTAQKSLFEYGRYLAARTLAPNTWNIPLPYHDVKKLREMFVYTEKNCRELYNLYYLCKDVEYKGGKFYDK